VYNRRPFAVQLRDETDMLASSSARQDRSMFQFRPAVGVCLTLILCFSNAYSQQGSVAAGQTASVTCGACHGPDGNSVTPDWPSLAGQHSAYIVRQLRAYRDKERPDPGMQQFAATLTDQQMLDLAAFYSQQSLSPKGADPELIGLGERIYRGGIPERGIAACIACHGPGGHGNPLAAFPKINGQHSRYLVKTLQEYASGDRRSDSDKNQMMRNVAELLLDDEMRALASYIQGLQ